MELRSNTQQNGGSAELSTIAVLGDANLVREMLRGFQLESSRLGIEQCRLRPGIRRFVPQSAPGE